MSFTLANFVVSLELALAAAGLLLGWRLVLRPAARATRPAPALPRWELAVADFLLFLLCIVLASMVAASAGSLLAKAFKVSGDPLAILTTACAQAGMLGGAWYFWSRPERGPPTPPPNSPSVLRSGAATFLISLPPLVLAAKGSDAILEYFNLPTERQNLVGMFENADSIGLLTVMITLAIVMAPVSEELVFRAGLFRFLRSRIPHWLALTGSALIFASLHVNWSTLEGLSSLLPLMVLAVMFSLAYERTGHIGTPIVAHALFNLNTIVLIFSGVGA